MRDLEKDYLMWSSRGDRLSTNSHIISYLVLLCRYYNKGNNIHYVCKIGAVIVSEITLAIEEYNNGVMHELYSKIPDVVLCKRYGAKLNKEVVL